MRLSRWGVVIVGVCGVSCASKPTIERAVTKANPSSDPVRAIKQPQSRRQVYLRDVTFSPDNSRFVVVRRVDIWPQIGGEVEVWDGRTKARPAAWSVPTAVSSAVFLGKDTIAILTSDGLQWWNWKTRTLTRTVAGVGGQTLACSASQKWLATEHEIRRGDGKKVAQLQANWPDHIRALAFSPDEKILVTGAWNVGEGIEAFDVPTGRALWKAQGDQQGNIVFSPDGRLVAVSTIGGVVLLKPVTGRLVRRLGKAYGGEIRFLDNETLEQDSPKLRLTFRVSNGKTLKSEPIADADAEFSAPDGSVRFHLTGAEKSVQF